MFGSGSSREVEFADTGRFIVTDHGTVYSSTEVSLEEYAPGLLDRVPLGRVLEESDLWLRLPMNLSLWVLPAGLLQGGPWIGATGMVSMYVAAAVLTPSGFSVYAVPVARLLDRVTLQALYFILTLSIMAQTGRFPELWTGVAGFVVLRWSLLSRLLEPAVERAARALYRMPVADQVLRSVITKHAIRLGISIPSLKRIEDDVRSLTGGQSD